MSFKDRVHAVILLQCLLLCAAEAQQYQGLNGDHNEARQKNEILNPAGKLKQKFF